MYRICLQVQPPSPNDGVLAVRTPFELFRLPKFVVYYILEFMVRTLHCWLLAVEGRLNACLRGRGLGLGLGLGLDSSLWSLLDCVGLTHHCVSIKC